MTKTNYHSILASLTFFIAFAGIGIHNTIDWVLYGVLTGIVIILNIIEYIKHRKSTTKISMSPLFLLFIIYCAISVIWSNYPLETLLASFIQIITALTGVILLALLGWARLMTSLHRAFIWIIAGSFLFELYVAVFIRHPILPPSLHLDPNKPIPGMDYWSAANLLTGGPIAGLPGNRNLLGFIALLMIVLSISLMIAKIISPYRGILGLILGVLAHVFTSSATITVALIGIALLYTLIVIMRSIRKDWLRPAYYIAGATSLLLLATIVTFSTTFFSLIGRDPDLTNRLSIWRTVGHLALERPTGWGWISFWAPWVEPYKNLVVVQGNIQLHAHNALIDIWLQLGIMGVIIALGVVAFAVKSGWHLAVSSGANEPAGHRSILNALPLLLLGALLVQSLTESRLLIEGNWMLFSIICSYVYSKYHKSIFTKKNREEQSLSSSLTNT
jgi:exopolysaccharide production protein ExoQ